MDCGATIDDDAAGLVQAGQFGECTLPELGRVRRVERLDPRGESVRHFEVPAGLRIGDGQVDREGLGADVDKACLA